MSENTNRFRRIKIGKFKGKVMREIRNKIKSKFKIDVDYEKSIKYFNELTDKDKDIERIYEKIKKEYSERLKNGNLNIKYEKLKFKKDRKN